MEDTQPDAEVKLLELKRKPAPVAATGGQTTGQSSTGGATSLTDSGRAGASSRVGAQAEEEDAPVPDAFDYVSDSETEEN